MNFTRTASRRGIFKFMLPLMGLFMLAVLSYGDPQKIWTVIPFLGVLLYLTAAEIRQNGKALQYRRFIVWRNLPTDVVDVRCSFFPALGYVRFKHFLFPWGKLYYLLDREAGRVWPGSRTDSMRSILSMNGKGTLEVCGDPDQIEKTGQRHPFWIVLVILSAVLGAMLPPLPSISTHLLPRLVAKLLIVQRDPVFLVIYACICLALAIRNKLRGFGAVGLAFLIGVIVSSLIRG